MPAIVVNPSVQNAKRALVALFVLFSTTQAFGFQGRMQDVSIVQCGAKSCATVTASAADVSWLSANMSLQKAKLTVKQTSGGSKEYNVNEIYFDHGGQRIYLHGVAELKNAEAFYDLKSEKLTVFAN